MSTAVFPTLAGQGWSITRTQTWKTRKAESISGKETAIADWPFPRYTWEVTFNVLRQGNGLYTPGDIFVEFDTLFGFFNARQGGADSFLYTDSDDNSVAGQVIGIGDGTTTTFQLVRAFGGRTQPVLAPNTVSHVYDNGVDLGGWGISPWGTTTPGLVTYTVPPVAGHIISADFTYYWPVRFVKDDCEFEKFMANRYRVKKLQFQSLL